MEIERAFRLAVPAILHRDLGDGDGLAPAFAAQADRRHAVAAHEAELAGLIDDAAQAVGEAAGAGAVDDDASDGQLARSEEHTSEFQSLMRTSYAGFCLKKKKNNN